MKSLTSRRLLAAEREYLYNKLLSDSNINQEIDESLKDLRDYFSFLIREILPSDLVNLFDKSKRISKKFEYFTLCGADLGITKGTMFPDDLCSQMIPDFDIKTRRRISSNITFYDLDIPYNKIITGSKFNKILDKFPSDKLDILREMHLNALKASYKRANFLIDYFPNCNNYCSSGFLRDTRTWKNVKDINEDWFNILANSEAINNESSIEEEDSVNIIEKLRELRLQLNLL